MSLAPPNLATSMYLKRGATVTRLILPNDEKGTVLSRRTFGTGLASSLAAPSIILPTQAHATIKDDDNIKVIRSFIAISILRRRIALRRLLVRTTTGLILGVALDGKHLEQNENRARVGGLLGGLQRPTIGAMLEETILMGALYLNGQILHLISESPEVDKVLLGLQVMLAHGDVSWQPGKMRTFNVTGYPLDEQIEQMRRVGELYLYQRELLIAMVYPVLGNDSAAGF